MIAINGMALIRQGPAQILYMDRIIEAGTEAMSYSVAISALTLDRNIDMGMIDLEGMDIGGMIQ